MASLYPEILQSFKSYPSWSKFLSNMKEETIFSLAVEGIFKSEDGIIGGDNVDAGASAGEHFVC